MMKNVLRLSFISFFLFFGKAVYDFNLFADYFQSQNTTDILALIFGYAGIAGFVMVFLFNILQRAFQFGIAVIYTYILLVGCIFSSFYILHQGLSNDYLNYVISCNISVNLIIILAIRGLLIRTGNGDIKKIEKASNFASGMGLLMAGIVVMILLRYFNNLLEFPYYHYISAGIVLMSIFFMVIFFRKEKNAKAILDSLQEIKVKQNIFRLLTNRYFISILLLAAVATMIMVLAYSHFIRVSIIKYNTSGQLKNLFAISVIIFAIMSSIYEFFFKEKAYYSFGVRIHLILMPIVIIVLSIITLLNTFYLKITTGNEFFFFIPIIASLYLIFSHFAFVNLFYPVLNSLYMPLKSQNQNDFYIKSTYFGFFIGIGSTYYITIKLLPRYTYINESGYVLINIALVVLFILISRLLVYRNYKMALHKRLDLEENAEIVQKSFVQESMQRIKEYAGIKIIRLVNLLFLINPVKTKKFLSELTLSEDTFTQRAGLISSIKLYLLEIYNDIFKISKTKYFPSSPNRDKIEQLLKRFDEVKTKMQKPYYIPQLSISKKDIERVYGAILAVYAPAEQQGDILNRLVKDTKLPVAKNAIISAAGVNDTATIKSVIERLGIAELSNAAYSALLEMDGNVVEILEDAFYQTGQNEKVQVKIVRLLGDIASEQAVEYLLRKLNYTNQNIISAALEALSKCNISLPEKKAMIIKHELNEVCKYIVWNTSLLIDLEKHFASDILLDAIKIELRYNYKSLFNLLSLLLNPGSVELIRNNLWSNNYEKVSFALELASVIIKDEMKPMILPLIRPMSNEERLKKMQTVFTTEKMAIEDILYDIIQRDYKWINPWTKACAIMEIEKRGKAEDLPILLANMVNPDPMLAELSALSVYKIDKDAYFTNKSIFDNQFTNIVSKAAIQAIETCDNKEKLAMPTLKFEIIKYLQGVDEFSSIPGEILKYLTDDVTPLTYKAGEKIEEIDNLDISYYHYIIYSGKVNLYINDVFVKCFEKNTLLSAIDLLIDYDAEIKLVAVTDVSIYKIDPSEFADNLSFYDEIPFSIIENTKEKHIAIYEQIIKNEREFLKRELVYS